ncbi:MAG: DUF1326 domain-containing protein [Acidobacteriota bacterium]
MRKFPLYALAGVFTLCYPMTAEAALMQGQYVETRSADVYTGPCFANGEMGLAGREAILAWRVDEGGLNGVSLAGLSVVGIVRANATLGDPFGQPFPAKAVMIVDQRADRAQKAALVAFARQMAGGLLDNVVQTEMAPIDIVVRHGENGHIAKAIVQAGDLARIETRPMGPEDHYCGNEVTYYPPLSPTSQATPAVALTDRYSGPGLGVSWTSRDRRSAFVGTFSLD